MRFAILALVLTIAAFPLGATPVASTQGTTAASTPLDLTHLVLGDGQLAAAPEVGSIWPCRMAFDGGGAFRDGPWFNIDGTFDLTAKIAVDGTISWPSALEVTRSGDQRILVSNGLPSSPTGVFPITPDDPAYQYDRNPNAIRAQPFVMSLAAVPIIADRASCLHMGAIGVLLNSGALFSAVDAAGRDAVAHEVQDACNGHPQMTGLYHYHSITSCIEDAQNGHSELVGYALDGFGIYGHQGEDGEVLRDLDLDECHGHTHTIVWDGETIEMYHYHATWEYPYTIGCFRGTPEAVLNGTRLRVDER